MTPSLHVRIGLGFHPENLCHKDMVILNGALGRGNDAQRAPPPLPPTVEAFAQKTTHGAHSPPKTEACIPFNHDTSYRKKSDIAQGTSEHPSTRPHHQSSVGPVSLLRRRGEPLS
jgi:hypothetical protein